MTSPPDSPSSSNLAALEGDTYRAPVENAPDAIIVHAGGRLVYTNAAAVALLGGMRPEDLVGQPILRFVHPDDHAMVSERVRDILAGAARTALVHERLMRFDGTLVDVEIASMAVQFGGRPAIQVVGRDVTARLRVEAELREKEAQLRQAAKMEAVGHLAGGVAHDFNNLLTVINSYADFLLGDIEDPGLRADIEEISKAGARAAGLTRQLLAFSRKSVIDPQVLGLDQVLGDIQKLLARTIGEHVELVLRIESGVWNVKADLSHVEQVVMNLALNARDAMPGGGTLTLALCNVSSDAAGGRQPPDPGDYVLIEVSDTGIGMSVETQSHIFEPFFTTKEEGRGTGLGLATVIGNVGRSGGRIEVESAPGAGTTFRVYLPRTHEARRSASRPIAPLKTGAGLTILLVEDDGAVRALANRILSRAGFSVIEAITGDDALELFRRHVGEIDLVLSDVIMPKISGKSVADALRTIRPDLPMLFMSGYTDDLIAPHGLLAEGVRLLKKPFTAAVLLTAVDEAIHARAPATRT